MGRPSKPIISKDRAANAALEVIDEEGLDGLSLQRVAKKIGVKAPSLYYHFHNKADMMAAVARLILKQAYVPDIELEPDWRKFLVTQCIAARKSILRHPNAAPLMLQFFPRHLMLGAYEHWIQKYNVSPELQMLILDGTEKLTFGSALLGAMSRAKGLAPLPPFDPGTHEHLATAVTANTFDEDAMFEESVRRFLSAF